MRTSPFYRRPSLFCQSARFDTARSCAEKCSRFYLPTYRHVKRFHIRICWEKSLSLYGIEQKGSAVKRLVTTSRPREFSCQRSPDIPIRMSLGAITIMGEPLSDIL